MTATYPWALRTRDRTANSGRLFSEQALLIAAGPGSRPGREFSIGHGDGEKGVYTTPGASPERKKSRRAMYISKSLPTDARDWPQRLKMMPGIQVKISLDCAYFGGARERSGFLARTLRFNPHSSKFNLSCHRIILVAHPGWQNCSRDSVTHTQPGPPAGRAGPAAASFSP